MKRGPIQLDSAIDTLKERLLRHHRPGHREVPRIDLGAAVLATLPRLSGAVVERRRPSRRSPSTLPRLRGAGPPGGHLVWGNHRAQHRRAESDGNRLRHFLTIGTSALVHPAAGRVQEAKRRGAFTVEMNLEATPASDQVDLAIHGPAEKILDQVERRMTESRS